MSAQCQDWQAVTLCPIAWIPRARGQGRSVQQQEPHKATLYLWLLYSWESGLVHRPLKRQIFYKHQRRDKGNPNTSSHIEHSKVKVRYPDAGIPTGQGPGWETNGARVPQHGSRLMLGQWTALGCCASIRPAMVGIYPCIYVKLFILE